MTIKNNKYTKSDNAQLLGTKDPKEIVYQLLNGLNKKLELTINSIDKGEIEIAKENALKAQNIAFALRKSLDRENGGEVAEGLDFLYGHIHFATDKLIKSNKKDYLQNALFVSSEILSGWKGLVNKIA